MQSFLPCCATTLGKIVKVFLGPCLMNFYISFNLVLSSMALRHCSTTGKSQDTSGHGWTSVKTLMFRTTKGEIILTCQLRHNPRKECCNKFLMNIPESTGSKRDLPSPQQKRPSLLFKNKSLNKHFAFLMVILNTKVTVVSLFYLTGLG